MRERMRNRNVKSDSFVTCEMDVGAEVDAINDLLELANEQNYLTRYPSDCRAVLDIILESFQHIAVVDPVKHFSGALATAHAAMAATS